MTRLIQLPLDWQFNSLFQQSYWSSDAAHWQQLSFAKFAHRTLVFTLLFIACNIQHRSREVYRYYGFPWHWRYSLSVVFVTRDIIACSYALFAYFSFFSLYLFGILFIARGIFRFSTSLSQYFRDTRDNSKSSIF